MLMMIASANSTSDSYSVTMKWPKSSDRKSIIASAIALGEGNVQPGILSCTTSTSQSTTMAMKVSVDPTMALTGEDAGSSDAV